VRAVPTLSTDTLSWLYRRMVRIYATAAIIAIGAGSVLIPLTFDLPARLAVWRIAAVMAAPAIAFAITLVVDMGLIALRMRPIRALAAAGDAPRLVVTLLRLPLDAAVRVLAVHFPVFTTVAMLGMIALDAPLEVGWRGTDYIALWMLSLLLGTGHAIFEYFGVAAAVRDLMPRLGEASHALAPERWRDVTRIDLRRKLAFVTIFTAFVPLVVLGATVLIKQAGVERGQPLVMPLWGWIGLLVGIGLAMMVAFAVRAADDVARSAQRLTAAMARVEAGDWTAHLPLASTDEFATLFEGFNRMADGLAERERLRDAFGRYVAPELAQKVLRDGVSVAGVTVDATVMFVDIRDFTALSETLSATDSVALLNRCFARMVEPIRAEGGWVNKYLGDGLMAVFGVPVRRTDHAAAAVRAAAGIRAAVDAIGAELRAEGRPPIRIGIGIQSGEVVAGSIGSPDRLEYTVIGDTVNVASRIEALNKELGTTILLGDDARAAAGRDDVRAMPPMTVKGKSEPLQVYALD
jgi:adenylate cyclase